MSGFVSKAAFGAALGLAALSLAASAKAARLDDSQRVVVIVKATDAELHTPLGAKKLALRIRTAAAEACGGSVFPASVVFSDGFRQCREAAIDSAIKDVDSPLLTDALGRPPKALARNSR